MAGELSFSVLGPLEVRVGGRLQDVGGPLPRALLALLLLRNNKPIRDERLCELLWGEDDPSSHKDKLHQHVSRLRAVLEPDRKRGEAANVLVSRAGSYRLVAGEEQLDSLRFRRLAREGREAAEVGEWAVASTKLREALDLWRTEQVLPDLDEQVRDTTAVAELEHERRAALEARIEAELHGLNRYDVAELRTLFEADPTDERFCAHLMLALYRQDRAAAANDVYWDARKALEAQGREPGEALKRRHRDIELRKPTLDFRPAGAQGTRAGPPAPRGRPEWGLIPRDLFVGREDQLADLGSALADAGAGRGCLVLVSGGLGIGKSRLAAVLAEQARREGVETLWGSVSEGGGMPPNWPWVQVFQRWLAGRDVGEIRRLTGADAPVLAQMVPELAERLPGLSTPAQLDEPATRFRLQNALVRVLKRSAAERPLLLVLDNLHNASGLPLELLRFLVDSIGDARILAIGIYRDTPVDEGPALNEFLGTLPRAPLTRRMQLRGLPQRDVSAYFEQALGLPPTASLVASLHERTSGNPQFLVQVVRSLAEEGPDLARVEQKLVEEVPDELREMVRWRLTKLTEDARYVLDYASVIGRYFDLEVLESAAGLDTEQLLELLDEGIRLGFIDELPSDALRHRFSHAVVRDALYRQLGALRRSQLHRRVGEAYEQIYGDSAHLATLAHHWSHAQRAEGRQKALDYLRRAGAQAMQVLAYEDAVMHFTGALKRVTDPRDRCALLLALADAQMKAGHPAAAQQGYRQAAEAARDLGAPEELARAALGIGNAASEFGLADAGLIRLLEEALDALGGTPTPLRAQVLGRLAVALYWVDPLYRDGLTEQRERVSAEAVAIARAAGDDRVLAFVLDARHYAIWAPDSLPERLDLADEIVATATRSGDRQMVLQGRMWRFVNLVEVGDLRAADVELEAYSLLADTLRQPLHLFWPRAWRAMRALMAGRFAEAEHLAEQARAVGGRGQDAAMLQNTISSQLFFIRFEQRTHAELESTVTELVNRYPELPAWRLALALTQLVTGRRDDARREYERFAADGFAHLRRDGIHLPTLALLADLATALDDAAGAERLYTLLLPYEERVVALGFATVCMGSVSHYLGRLALLRGDVPAARAHLERAVQANERIGALPHLLRSRRDLASLLLRHGGTADAEHAARLREDVARRAADLGLPVLAQQAWALR
jgi:DNA-binding SARP family transcriptional activator/tetratricopeptide (TPR) repeat protein